MGIKLETLDPKLQERIRQADAEERARRVGGLAARIAQQTPIRALGGSDAAPEGSTGRVAVCVRFILCLKRTRDDDATAFSVKSLRDEIAAWLGLDDADPRIQWHYEQHQTRGREGTLVQIEVANSEPYGHCPNYRSSPRPKQAR